DGGADGRAHNHRHRPPPVDHPRRRPHPGVRERPHRGRGPPRRARQEGRRLRAAERGDGGLDLAGAAARSFPASIREASMRWWLAAVVAALAATQARADTLARIEAMPAGPAYAKAPLPAGYVEQELVVETFISSGGEFRTLANVRRPAD